MDGATFWGSVLASIVATLICNLIVYLLGLAKNIPLKIRILASILIFLLLAVVIAFSRERLNINVTNSSNKATTIEQDEQVKNPVFGWGPERNTFTNEVPATYVVFNSIVDSSSIGNETNFVRIKEAGTDGYYTDSVAIEKGKIYSVFIYYHNNAASNLGLVANNTKVSVIFTGKVSASNEGGVSATIFADNAEPARVWDAATIKTNSEEVINLRYVENSAMIHNSGGANGSILDESIFTSEGALIGYSSLDGDIPGCAEYSGYITFELEAY